jgi:hypothetical protein
MMIGGKTELEFAIQALEDIANPIGALQRYAKEQGRQLDGYIAVQLSKDPAYIKGMASDALAALGRKAR